MNCNSSTEDPISIDFNEAGELFPTSVSFSYGKSDYDTLICEFDSQAARTIQEESYNRLEETQRAIVKIGGEPVRAMYYEPEFLSLGLMDSVTGAAGRLELHDLHEHLKKGSVNYAPNKATLFEVVERVYKSRVKKDIFTGLNFNIEDESVTGSPSNEQIFFDIDPARGDDQLATFESSYSIHFDGDQPLAALNEIKNRFGVDTHISPEGELTIGYNSNNTYTASNLPTGIDYHVKDSSISGSISNISRVNIEGPIVKEFGNVQSTADRRERVAEWINPVYSEETGFRLNITVENTNVQNGDVVDVRLNNIDPHEDNLERIGKRKLVALELQNSSGSITVDMETSNTKNIPFIKDKIALDVGNICGKIGSGVSFSDEYFVSKVMHSVEDVWEMDVSLQSIPLNPADLDVSATFYDLSEDQTWTYEEVYGYPLGEG